MTREGFEALSREVGECREWHGPAFVWVDGRAQRPARAALLFSGKRLATGTMVRRTCRTEGCVKLEHLRTVTRREWGREHRGQLTPFPSGEANPRWSGGGRR